MVWDPEQYSRFEKERLAPALDLLRAVPAKSMGLIADLGCGTGSILPHMRSRWPQARIMALDKNNRMLEVARTQGYADHYIESGIESWSPDQGLDLIYANAVFHWLQDQGDMIRRCFCHLNPGGVLAVQIPNNQDQPSHRHMLALARDQRWQHDPGERILQPHAHRLQDYYRWCEDAAGSVKVWQTRYLHYFENAGEIVEWMKGSSLGQILAILEPGRRASFLSEYAAAVAQSYPPVADGRVCFLFKRIFLCAIKS